MGRMRGMIELESPLEPRALLDRVQEVLPTPMEWAVGGAHARTAFYGRVRASGFWVMTRRSRWEKNSFNPMLVVQVSPTPSGSRLTATSRLPRPVQVFMAVWLGAVLFIGSMGLYEALSSGAEMSPETIWITAVVVPVVVLTIGIAAYIVRDLGRRRRLLLEEWLRRFVESISVAP